MTQVKPAGSVRPDDKIGLAMKCSRTDRGDNPRRPHAAVGKHELHDEVSAAGRLSVCQTCREGRAEKSRIHEQPCDVKGRRGPNVVRCESGVYVVPARVNAARVGVVVAKGI